MVIFSYIFTLARISWIIMRPLMKGIVMDAIKLVRTIRIAGAVVTVAAPVVLVLGQKIEEVKTLRRAKPRKVRCKVGKPIRPNN